MNIPYHSIPEIPSEITAPNIIARTIDGLGFRFRWATEGLTENEFNFRPCESSMSMMELLKHIHNLAFFANKTFGGSTEQNKSLSDFIEIKLEILRIYAELSERLKSMTDESLSEYIPKNGEGGSPFWLMLNGPIADALTHVGQITSWRRIAGNPQPSGVNPFFGKKT